MSSRKESDFRSQILASAVEQGFHVINIPDEGAMLRGAGAARGGSGIQKPYDLGLLYHGTYFGVELKATPRLSWQFSRLEEHQEAYLQECVAHRGVGVVIVRFFFRPSGAFVKQWDKRYPGIPADSGMGVYDRAYVIPIHVLVHQRQHLAYSGVSALDAPDMYPALPRSSRTGWDLLAVLPLLTSV